MAELQIELLGAFRVRVGGRAVPGEAWHRRRPAALVKLLALAPGHRMLREEIMEALWPDLGPDAAGANLRKALYYVRRALDGVASDGATLISSEADLVSLPVERLQIDVETYRATVAAARRGNNVEQYRRAVEIYRNGLLPEDRYEEWAVGARDELNREFREVLEELATLLEARGELDAATDIARRLVAADPLREESHAGLMRLYALSGRRSDALHQYQQLQELLESELGVEPSAETQRLYEEIRARQSHAPELSAELWERVGELRMLSGDAAGSAKAFELALDAGAAAASLAGLERKCADAWLMQHRPDLAAPHLTSATARLAEPAERGRILRALANLAWESGDITAAQRYGEQALAVAQAHGTPDDVAAAHEALAIVSHFRGEWREGLESELERLAANELGSGQLARVVDIHHCIGQYHLYGDDLADSVEGYARGLLDRAEESGAVRAQAFAWCLLGESLLLQARWDESEGCLARSCALHGSLGSRSGALPWQRRAELAASRGKFEEADACLREASGIATVSRMASHVWGRIHATAAFSAVERGDVEGAVRSVEAAAATVARYGDCPTCSALLNPIAAEAYSLLGDVESSRSYAESATRVAQMFNSSAWRAMAEWAAGSQAAAEGDGQIARERYETARDLFRRAGQPFWAERSLKLASILPS